MSESSTSLQKENTQQNKKHATNKSLNMTPIKETIRYRTCSIIISQYRPTHKLYFKQYQRQQHHHHEQQQQQKQQHTAEQQQIYKQKQPHRSKACVPLL